MNFCTHVVYILVLTAVSFQSSLCQVYPNTSIEATNGSTNAFVYDESLPYCFRFTWLGPDYDNSSSYNSTTCFDFVDEKGIPCRQPLVVSHNGTPPDINYLWENHRGKVLCKQSRGNVCAKYSYSFNGELQNVTYLCTKVFAKGEGPVTSGCYKQIINEYEVELCVCKSGTGPYKPCNSSISLTVNFIFLMFFAIANLILIN